MEKKDISNVEITLFALFQIGGATKRIHTEHIAWKAYQIAPEKFSWRLPEFRKRGFPDKTPVRFALEQAKKKGNGSLVKGRAGGDASGKESEGWILTPKGVEWIKENKLRIAEFLDTQKSSLHPREVARFLRKVKGDASFRNYQTSGNLNDVSFYMITDMLGCTPDAQKETISEKFERFVNMAKLCGDAEVIDFLEKCEEKFSLIIP